MTNAAPFSMSQVMLSANVQPSHSRTAATNAVPLLLQVRRLRVLLPTVVGILCIVLFVYFCHEGITIRSLSASNSNDVDLADYTTSMALLVALVVNPVVFLVSSLVPLTLLCLSTKFYLSLDEKHMRTTRIATIAASTIVIWLLTTAFFAIRMDATQSEVINIITGSDLKTVSTINDSSMETFTRETWWANSPVDSIVRGSMELPVPPSRLTPTCSLPSPRLISTSVEYAFAPTSWHDKLRVANDVRQSKVAVSELSEKVDGLPTGKEKTEMLMVLGFNVLQSVFSNRSMTQLTSKSHSVVKDAATILSDKVLDRTTNPNTRLLNVDDASVSFQETAVDGHALSMSSVTFNIPFISNYLRRKISISEVTGETTKSAYSPKEDIFEINAKEACGEDACIVGTGPKSERSTTSFLNRGPTVKALSLCLDKSGQVDVDLSMDPLTSDCTKATNSFLVVSFSSAIDGDRIERNGSKVLVSGARKSVSVTVGILKWVTTDLSAITGRSCEVEGACEGVAIQLSDKSSTQLLVGKANLPNGHLTKFVPNMDMWPMLLAANTQEIGASEEIKSDLIIPRRFEDFSKWKSVTGNDCQVNRGRMLTEIERNHWYTDDSFSPAFYSSAFWLLQNGVQKRADGRDMKTSTSLATPENVDIVMSIPLVPAILAYVGCGVLVVLCLLVFVAGNRRASVIEECFKPKHLAQMLAETRHNPLRLLNGNLLHIEGDDMESSQDIRDFEVAAVTLRHKKWQNTLVQVPPFMQTSNMH